LFYVACECKTGFYFKILRMKMFWHSTSISSSSFIHHFVFSIPAFLNRRDLEIFLPGLEIFLKIQ
jgi:hypothetical protein